MEIRSCCDPETAVTAADSSLESARLLRQLRPWCVLLIPSSMISSLKETKRLKNNEWSDG